MMRRSHSIAVVVALAGLAAASVPSGFQAARDRTEMRSPSGAQKSTQTTTQVATPQAAAAFLNWYRRRATNRSGYPSGPGWSTRHVQRMARKRRNVLRNRKAHR